MPKQQKCGTCRFFQEAGLAGSGWCHHPDRKTSSDVMIMVRRSELACRDDWSRSLWQPAAAGQDEAEPQYSRSPLTGPLPPTSQKDFATLLAQDIVSSGVSGEDVLLSEARIISEPAETKNHWETPVRAIQMPNFDPRTAIFRAREAYRDKVKAKATEARLLSSAEPLAEPAKEPIPTSPDARALTMEPQQLDVRSAEPPLTHKLKTSIPPKQSSETPIASPVRSTRSGTVEKPRTKRSASQNGTSGGIGKDSEELISQPAIDSFLPEGPPVVASRRATDESRVVVPMASGLPEWYRTDLPRVCRTCRDYRPSADGMRGWCANGWAFTHRRLVQSDDPPPCHSAIGDWWAPVDDVWLVAADVSSHGRATPHLDRITGQETVRRRRS